MKKNTLRLLFVLTILLSGFATIYLNLQSTDTLQPKATLLFEAQVEEQSERVLPDIEFVKFLIKKVKERL